MENFVEQLKEIRKSPRKMHMSYLMAHNLYNKIEEQAPEYFNTKEKIDFIIEGVYNKCECCEKYAKPNSKWCSITCMNKDKTRRDVISEKNTQNSKERLKKAKETRILKYGVSSVQDIPEAKLKTKKSKQKYYDQVINETFKKYGLDIQKLSDIEYLKAICDNCGAFDVQNQHFNNMPYTTMIRHFERIGFFPNFKKGSSSMGEQELYLWISSLGYEAVNNDRKSIGLELDIYIPEKNVAIEYNGLYWHSDKHLNTKMIDPKLYHFKKYKKCLDKNIKLIQIYEDEWVNKKDIVKSIILSKLGNYQEKYYARKMKFSEVSVIEAKSFLNDNHIQGYSVGKHYGLYFDSKLISIMTIGKSRFHKNEYELIRYACLKNAQVVGGFSKLLKNCKEVLKISTMKTYADLRYSNGETYDKFGKFIKTTTPGYFWTKTSMLNRLHRFSTQKHKLKKLLGADVDLTKTESEIMQDFGYCKIYDCGNKLFEI